MTPNQPPPPILDCAVVLAYAIHDDSVKYSGRTTTSHNWSLIGPDIRHSAICHNLTEPRDYLFFFCNEHWSVEAAAGYDTVEEAEAFAMRTYSGIENVLVRTSYSGAEIEVALNDYWEGRRCALCQKWPHQTEHLAMRNNDWVCDECT